MLSYGQASALARCLDGENIFLTGGAGTGKSHVLKLIMAALREEGKRVMVCAPTGIAALNIGGTTIHRAFEMDIRCCPNAKNLPLQVEASDVIVIDEISMCRMDQFDFIADMVYAGSAARMEGCGNKHQIQLILSGDFFQLPPVLKRSLGDRRYDDFKNLCNYYGTDIGKGYAFQCWAWDHLGITTVELTENLRQGQDREFAENLNLIRHGDLSGLDYFNQAVSHERKCAPYLCTTNADANVINETMVARLNGYGHTYHAEVSGEVRKGDMPTSDVLILKEGMDVVFVKNDSDGEYMNGSTGIVAEVFDDKIKVRLLDGRRVDVYPCTWDIQGYKDEAQCTIGQFTQIPVKPAYAMTIHKSQGQTYDAVNLRITPRHPCFEVGQLYVALSRCRTFEGLHLDEILTKDSVKVSQDVLEFYSKFGGQKLAV